MGDLPDPKMEVLIVPYKTLFCEDIPWNLALKNRPYIREVPPIKVPEMAFKSLNKMTMSCSRFSFGACPKCGYPQPIQSLDQYFVLKHPWWLGDPNHFKKNQYKYTLFMDINISNYDYYFTIYGIGIIMASDHSFSLWLFNTNSIHDFMTIHSIITI